MNRYTIWAIRVAGHADREPPETLQCEGGSEQQTLLGWGGLRWSKFEGSPQARHLGDDVSSPVICGIWHTSHWDISLRFTISFQVVIHLIAAMNEMPLVDAVSAFVEGNFAPTDGARKFVS